MSQHGRFEQDYLRMKVQIDKLKASGLSEEQRTIFSELDKMIQHFEHHLFTEYIDFEEICDNLPDAIYVASPDGTSIYVNDTYTKLSGITKAEIIGENVHQINREKKHSEISKKIRDYRCDEKDEYHGPHQRIPDF